MQKSQFQLLVLAGNEDDGHRPALDQLANVILSRLHDSGEDVELKIVPLAANASDDLTYEERQHRSRTFLLIPEDEFGLRAVEWRQRIDRILSVWRPSSILFLVDWNRRRSTGGFIRVYLRETITPLHFIRLSRKALAPATMQTAIDLAGAEIGDIILQEAAPALRSDTATHPSVASARPQPADLTTLIELHGQANVDRVGVPKPRPRSPGELRSDEYMNDLAVLSAKPSAASPPSDIRHSLVTGVADKLQDFNERFPGGTFSELTRSRSRELEAAQARLHELKAMQSRLRDTMLPPVMSGARSSAPRRSVAYTLTKWFLLGASVGLLALLFRRELGYLASPLMKLFGSAMPPLTIPPSSPVEDRVELSAFGPPTCTAGEQILIQTAFHIPADQAQAFGMVAAADPTAAFKVKTLSVPLKPGDKVSVLLETDGCHVDPPTQEAMWQGSPILLQFLVSVPGDRTRPVTVKITLIPRGLPPARIMFKIEVEKNADQRSTKLLGDDARIFQRAFLSYSKNDRVSVLKTAQTLNLLRFKYFLDLLSLKPGERRWEHRIFDEIEQSDLFLLFWSAAASKSKWVLAETEYALRFADKSDQKSPDIKPYILETVSDVPTGLESINFNDPFLYLISGAEAEAAKSP